MEMGMAFRKFTVPQSTDVVSFELADARFVCRPQIAAGVLLRFGRLGSQSGEGENTDNGKMLDAIVSFFQASLMPNDFPRFMALLDDPDIAIPMETLTDIAGWLGETYAGERPTGEDLSNSLDKPSTGVVSTAGASVETPTYSRSPEIVPSI